MKSKDNILWVDILKGLGMVLVVAGHIYKGSVKDYIYLFHMPLFFYLSGYLFKKREEIKSYFSSKGLYLGIPYITFIIIIYFGLRPLNPFNHEFKEVYRYVITPIIGGKKMIGVFWFISVLFITQQIYNVIRLYIKRMYLFYFAVFFSLLLGYANSIFFPSFWMPLNLNVIPAVIPFFALGEIDNKFDISYKVKIFLFLSLLIFLPFLLSYENYTYDFKYSQYGIPFLTFYISSVLVLIFKEISILITNYKTLTLGFSEIGKASMVIMYVHMPVKDHLSYILGDNHFLLLTITIIISYLIYRLILLNSYTRILFMGSKKDLDNLKLRLNAKKNIS